MTLVVGALRDKGAVLIGDSKITISPEATVDGQTSYPHNVRDFENALPKIVWLSPSIVAGYSGDRPEDQLRLLVSLRGSSISDVLDRLQAETAADFIVMSNEDRPTMWSVIRQRVEDRTHEQRAFIGEPSAIEQFRIAWDQTPQDLDLDLIAEMSIGWVLTHGRQESVGAFYIRAQQGTNGFVLVPGGQGTFAAPGDTMILQTATGHDDSPGAIAYFIRDGGLGLLYRHEDPWNPIKIHAASDDEFEALAREQHGQTILFARPDFVEWQA